MPKVVEAYLGGVGRRRFSAGPVLFLESGTIFSGYLQQRIGDNRWDKINTYSRMKGIRAYRKAVPRAGVSYHSKPHTHSALLR